MKKNVKKVKRITRRKMREWLWGYVFILPWVIGISLFFIYACSQSLVYAFSDVRLSNGLSVTYQGITNFVNVLTTDNLFPVALASFAINLVMQAPIIVAFSLIMAMLLNSKIKCRALFRVIFFLPVIIATGPVMEELTTQGVASVPMVSQNTITAMLTSLPNWLATPIEELFSSLILVLWYSGVQILIFIAGLQKVPRDVYEAAKIDGASGWECFWKVTLPTVKPMILLNAIYTIVALATSGDNEIITMIYDNMFNSAVGRGYGYAAAMAWVYAIVVAIALLIAYLLLKEKSDKHVVYEKRLVRMKGGYYNDGRQKTDSKGSAARPL